MNVIFGASISPSGVVTMDSRPLACLTVEYTFILPGDITILYYNILYY